MIIKDIHKYIYVYTIKILKRIKKRKPEDYLY